MTSVCLLVGASLWLIGPCGFCPRYAHNFTDQSDVSNYPMLNESDMTCVSYWFLSCWLLSCCGGWTRVWIKWFSNDATFLANWEPVLELVPLVGWPTHPHATHRLIGHNVSASDMTPTPFVDHIGWPFDHWGIKLFLPVSQLWRAVNNISYIWQLPLCVISL